MESRWLVLGKGNRESMVRSQTASLHDSDAAMYSASVDDVATTFCFLADQEIIPLPMV